jgi:predicted AlkP superfamily pyrophosphatase or phosphodiesterase
VIIISLDGLRFDLAANTPLEGGIKSSGNLPTSFYLKCKKS